MREVGALVFPDFELLDLFGPLELFGMREDAFRIAILAEGTGPVASAQGPRILPDRPLDAARRPDILLVPGGMGTRREVGNPALLGWLGRAASEAAIVASVCTGAALLARAGLLDGRRATTNKRAFGWVRAQGPATRWQGSARWVEDGPFWTASGVSAGMDMTVALIAHLLGPEAAADAARAAEYVPNPDPSDDPFAIEEEARR